MKKFLLALGLLCAAHAHASVCTTLSGAVTQSSFTSAVGSCGSGNTVALAASTVVTLTSPVAMPCGVSLAGPTVAPVLADPGDGWSRYVIRPTAKIQGSISGRQQTLDFNSCTTAVRFSYIEFNGEQPATYGGGQMYFPGNQNHVEIDHDYFHGNQTVGTACCTDSGDTFIYLDGSNSGTNTQNVLIHDNFFGATGDCSNIMQNINGSPNYQGSDAGGTGGACAALGVHTGATNLQVYNNDVYYQEEGFKIYEGTTNNNQDSYCNTCSFYNNDFSVIHRIALETQINPCYQGTGGCMEVYNNSFHDNYYGFYGQFGLSLANNVLTETDAYQNLLVANNAPITGYIAMAIETWGSGSTVENNVIQGYWANGDEWNYLGNFIITGNKMCGAGTPGSGMTYINRGTSSGPLPTLSGNSPAGANSQNVTGSSSCSALTSTAPSISPASGSQTYPLTVTVANTGTNMGSWYTTDGSTPVPGAGTAQYIAAGGTFSLGAAATVKAVGMWGSYNQPPAYAANFGYVPSSAVSQTYTSGSPVTATPTFSPATESFITPPISVTLSDSTGGSSIYYTTNGTTPTPSSTLYTGPISVGATTTIQAMATSGSLPNSGVGSAIYTYTPPTLTGGYQSNATNVNTMHVGAGSVQQTAYGTYTAGADQPYNTSTNLDPYGDSVTWSSSNGTVLTVGSTGLITCATAGTANSQASSGGHTFFVWGWTCLSATPSSYVAQPGAIVVGP